jgi:hypothetical protein
MDPRYVNYFLVLLTNLIRSSCIATLWYRGFFFHSDYFTDGRSPWTSDQLVARPLPTHRTTQTQNKYIHIPNIHALCGIRTHDPGFRASEDSTCLRSLGYPDRHLVLPFNKLHFGLNATCFIVRAWRMWTSGKSSFASLIYKRTQTAITFWAERGKIGFTLSTTVDYLSFLSLP